MNLDKLTTETRNPETLQLDQMSVADVLKQMNEEEKKVPLAISEVLGEIEAAVEQIVSSFKAGGRLIYMGAGTSGRLGVSADTVVGIAASGRTPYVIGGLIYADEVGAATVTISCNKDAEISQFSQIAIEIDAGPEVLTGSTRFILK